MLTILVRFLQPLPRSAIKLFYGDSPQKGCVRSSKKGRRGKLRVRFDPHTREPTITRRKAPKHDLMELPSSAKDRWRFPPDVRERLSVSWRAAATEALVRASDWQDDVWHLWVRAEGRKEGAPPGQAAAGRRDSDSAHLGPLSFIVDTGCGHNLIAERYVRFAGAMGLIRRLSQSVTLNTAGGPSKALGTVRIACPKFKGGSFEALVMPNTPAVLSVGERCMDHGFSFFWRARQRPYLL